MANATVSRLGQSGLSGDTNALFLKVFSGEVLTAFEEKTVMGGRTRVRNITSGKSAQFPAIGKVGASYHTPGAEIVGQTVEHGEKVITIDDLLIADVFIANIDEAKNHYEVRSEYTREMGIALAQTMDRNILSLAVKEAIAATAGATADHGAATRDPIGTSPTTSTLISAFYDAAEQFDNDLVPEEGRFAIVPPAEYYQLAQDTTLLSRDFNSANGDYSKAMVMNVAGFEIVKSTNMAVDHTSATRYPDTSGSKYAVDASTYAALCMHPQAVGTVKLIGMASEAEYDIRRQGWLAVSKMAIGHGILRPDCVRAIAKAAS